MVPKYTTQSASYCTAVVYLVHFDRCYLFSIDKLFSVAISIYKFGVRLCLNSNFLTYDLSDLISSRLQSYFQLTFSKEICFDFFTETMSIANKLKLKSWKSWAWNCSSSNFKVQNSKTGISKYDSKNFLTPLYAIYVLIVLLDLYADAQSSSCHYLSRLLRN